MRHLTRQTDARYRSRDNTIATRGLGDIGRMFGIVQMQQVDVNQAESRKGLLKAPRLRRVASQ